MVSSGGARIVRMAICPRMASHGRNGLKSSASLGSFWFFFSATSWISWDSGCFLVLDSASPSIWISRLGIGSNGWIHHKECMQIMHGRVWRLGLVNMFYALYSPREVGWRIDTISESHHKELMAATCSRQHVTMYGVIPSACCFFFFCFFYGMTQLLFFGVTGAMRANRLLAVLCRSQENKLSRH